MHFCVELSSFKVACQTDREERRLFSNDATEETPKHRGSLVHRPGGKTSGNKQLDGIRSRKSAQLIKAFVEPSGLLAHQGQKTSEY